MATQYPVQELIEDLVDYYPSSVDQFLVVVLTAGFPKGHLSSTQEPKVAYKVFTDVLGGLEPVSQKPILEAIIRDKTACASAKKWLAIVTDEIVQSEVAPELSDQEEIRQSQPKVAERLTHTLPDNLHLSTRKIATMVKLCVEPSDNLRVCAHPAATHSTGAAAAGLVAWILFADVCHLQKLLMTGLLELGREEEFSEEPLEIFIHKFDQLRSMLSLLADSTLDGQREARNRLSRAICQLPHSTSILKKGLQEIGVSLDADLGEMKGLRDRIVRDVERNRKKSWTKEAERRWVKKHWGDAVKKTLSGVADNGTALHEKFERVRGDIRQAMDLVRADWERCTNQLASCLSAIQGRRGKVEV